MNHDLIEMGKRAKEASYLLANLAQQQKNDALHCIAQQLENQQQAILEANAKDIALAKQQNIPEAVIDRLLITPERLKNIINEVEHVISLPDPIGKIIDGGKLASGISLHRIRTPLGVVGAIYEARPNVTVDIASLCLKTGNAVILRGGKETQNTNQLLTQIIQTALQEAHIPKAATQFIANPDRALIAELLKLDQYVDIIIPRGGLKLQQFCKQHSTIPVVVGGIGVCHLFVEQSADQQKALAVISNAKTQRLSTCNTLETLLVQKSIAREFLPKLANYFDSKQVKFHADSPTLEILHQLNIGAELLTDEQLYQEWLSADLNVVIVENLEQALLHIRKYGSQHSDGILTESHSIAQQFIARVDSAAVYVNASTRFTDGAQFGLGAEVAVSTQKLHARGPMGLDSLTTYKWVAIGDYTVRN